MCFQNLREVGNAILFCLLSEQSLVRVAGSSGAFGDFKMLRRCFHYYFFFLMQSPPVLKFFCFPSSHRKKFVICCMLHLSRTFFPESMSKVNTERKSHFYLHSQNSRRDPKTFPVQTHVLTSQISKTST